MFTIADSGIGLRCPLKPSPVDLGCVPPLVSLLHLKAERRKLEVGCFSSERRKKYMIKNQYNRLEIKKKRSCLGRQPSATSKFEGTDAEKKPISSRSTAEQLRLSSTSRRPSIRVGGKVDTYLLWQNSILCKFVCCRSYIFREKVGNRVGNFFNNKKGLTIFYRKSLNFLGVANGRQNQ
jgi:hypothetical protein